MPRFIDITGKRFGRLTILKKAEKKNGKKLFWLCKCDCGLTKEIDGDPIRRGAVVSCGCYSRERTSIRMSQISTTHGMSNTNIWWRWAGMRERCTNKKTNNYKNYGGRGIKVCDRWLTFENFYEDMKAGYSAGLSLERIDNNGNYEPGNCRWATRKEQMRNYRRNRLITHKGETKTLQEWSESTGLKSSTIRMRLSTYKWSPNDALTKGVTYP